MKSFPLTLAILIAAATPVLAQSGVYKADNFDFANGVRVEVPRPPARFKLSRRGRLSAARDIQKTQLIETNIANRMADLNTGRLLAGFTTGNSAVDGLIVESGKRNSVDPLLLYSIMHQESTFKQRALSPKGASGLMQLMPGTARRFGVSKIWDPKQNIEGGARYVRFLLDQFEGDVPLTLAGYNAGEGAVMKYGYRVPPYRETQEYVRRISKRYNMLRDPLTAQYANGLNPTQLAAARNRESVPLTIYEKTVFAVRMPDGRLQLVSQ